MTVSTFCTLLTYLLTYSHVVSSSSALVIFRVYCADHTYCTLRFSVNSTAENIKTLAADKLQLNRAPDDLCLVHVHSNGERSVFKDNDVSIPTALSLNGRIFVSPKDHLDALVNTYNIISFDHIPICRIFRYGLLLKFFHLLFRSHILHRLHCRSRKRSSRMV